ncbi:MarR family transcriptional regulator [Kitasatospora sp. NPDC056076]|uniref:MarR family transcriptional regulator n=1 Tax=Kitasatospora sp. NPDC056076 TaxID=3345703 RepID=UPI0035DA81AB
MPRKAQQGQLALVDMGTGEQVKQVKVMPRTPPSFDGKAFTMQSKGADTPLYSLGLTANEWAILDWLKEHGASSGPIAVKNAVIATEIGCSEHNVKISLARLVKMAIVLRTAPRSATYCLTPRRFWEGEGAQQVRTVARLDPPSVSAAPTPPAKSRRTSKRTANPSTTGGEDR